MELSSGLDNPVDLSYSADDLTFLLHTCFLYLLAVDLAERMPACSQESGILRSIQILKHTEFTSHIMCREPFSFDSCCRNYHIKVCLGPGIITAMLLHSRPNQAEPEKE